MPKCASTVPTMSDATATLISVARRRASMPCRRFRRLIRPIAMIAANWRLGPDRRSLRIIAVEPVDHRAHRVAGLAVAYRVEQRRCRIGTANQALGIRQHNRVVPRALDYEG